MAANHDNVDWMNHLSDDIKTIPLNMLAIPGSHNSFSYDLDKSGPLAPEYSANAMKWAKRFRKIANPFIKRWAVTQTCTVLEQLQAGVRYFDVRVSAKGADASREYHFSHGLYGNRIIHYLQEISEFIASHKTEVVIIDLNHFYDMNEDDHKRLIDTIVEVFSGQLCPIMPLCEMTLHNLVAASQQVVMFYHHPAVMSYPTLWPGHMIPSVWLDVTSPTEMLHKLEGNYSKGKPCDTFHVTQGVMTPTSGHIVRHSTKSLRSTMGTRAANAFVDWLKQKTTGDTTGVNICIMDFVEMSEFVREVIYLNINK